MGASLSRSAGRMDSRETLATKDLLSSTAPRMTALARLPVRITGDWQPVAYVGHVEWHGVALAEEPITALVLGRTPGRIVWSRVGRSNVNALSITLRVDPDEASESRYAVRIRLSMQPHDCRRGEGQADVQLGLRLISTAPFMFTTQHHRTGEPAWFARAWMAEETHLGALFLAQSDTRSVRNHLWHLREGIDAPEGFAGALAYGRSGSLRP